jgi:DNA-binding NarL/FixJ family response regulator
VTTFLIVDDHEYVRRGVRQVLAEHYADARFVEVSTAAQALEAALSEDPSLVLLDINLPGKSGLDVLEELKRLHAATPILVLSAYPEEEFALSCLRLGAAGYLTKSAASSELLAAVRRLLGGGRYVTSSLADRLVDALGGGSQQAPHELLSVRELQVLRSIANGKTLKEIAAELGLSDKTIATYRARIADKLKLTSNVEITRFALHHKLVE